MVQLYFIHPLRHDGREIESAIADEGFYGESDNVHVLQGVQTYVFSDGSILEVDDERLTVSDGNVAAVRAWVNSEKDEG